MAGRKQANPVQFVGDEAPAPKAAPDIAPKGRERKTEGKVRTTLVLDVDEYHALAELCLKLERATDRRGVAGSEVFRVLLGLATRENDPASDDLRRWLTREIEQNGGNRRGRT